MSGLIKDLKKFNRLATVANSTFATGGPGSSSNYSPTTQHIRFELINENSIKVHYQGAISVPSKSMLATIMSKLVEDALDGIKHSIETFAKNYKEQYESSIVLKINENTIIDNIEFTSYSVFRPAQSGMLRVTALIDVSGGDNVENYFVKAEKKEFEAVDKVNKQVKVLMTKKDKDKKTK